MLLDGSNEKYPPYKGTHRTYASGTEVLHVKKRMRLFGIYYYESWDTFYSGSTHTDRLTVFEQAKSAIDRYTVVGQYNCSWLLHIEKDKLGERVVTP